jgi:hypothetical protein
MQASRSTINIISANVQFPPYCYLRPDTKNYIGLSEAGKASVIDIMTRIGNKTVTPAQGTAEGKANIIAGKTLELTDWSERSKRVSQMFVDNPVDIVLLQEVSKNKEHKLSTLDDIFDETDYSVAQYSNFPLKLQNKEDQAIENILQRGTAVAVRENIHLDSTGCIELTLHKNQGKKIQTRAASIATFTTDVQGVALKVRAVSVHITGYASWAVKNMKDAEGKVRVNPEDTELQKKLASAQKSFREFLESCNEGIGELTHYLNELKKDDSFDIDLIGGDFNFDSITSDGVAEVEILKPLTSCGGKEGILQQFGYQLNDSLEPTNGARRIDYTAVKLSEKVKQLFEIQVSSRNLVSRGEGFVSDHSFVNTEISFKMKQKL